ncbi:Mitochondrial intermediate peptidase [Coemansia sp. RSA 1878]|nr:Mitochondrial intermediate peptidase [Coemansia sp. RSA 1878]
MAAFCRMQRLSRHGRLWSAAQHGRTVYSLHAAQRMGARRLSTQAHEVIREDDVQLRDAFDLPTQTTLGSSWFHKGRPTGLLMESRFVSPTSFRQAGKEAVVEAESLVARVLNASTATERRQIVKCLDQLSDALCRVMDVAELVRQVHPDSSWQTAAENVYGEMLEFMNGLNTHVGLYTKLVDAMDDPSISKDFSDVEHEVARSFRRDFERSGIHLAASAHARFVELSSRIHDRSRTFLRSQGLAPAGTVQVPVDQLHTLPASVVSEMLQTHAVRTHDGVAVVDVVPDDWAAQYVLRDCEDSKVRETVYCAWQRGASSAVQSLEGLLEDRLALARTVGFESFAHMTLDDKMARTPDHVDEFLRGLAVQARPRWDTVAQGLARDPRAIRPWDRDYYVGRQQAKMGALPQLAEYFSIGRVVMGLSRVFERLYGVTLRATVPQPGEIWHSDVRKLEAVDEDGHLLGVVYCDVFARSSKAHVGAAHFTARCARRVDDDVGRAVCDSTVVERDGMRFQLPVVVLICNFPPPMPNSPPLLSWANVETIFHEMGHAMHSMLGQNGFHNVAGTRCPVDFVELPSVLMEHFARSPHVLSLFASHYKTNEPLPPGLLRQRADRRRRFAALDLHAQLFMSALDQRYHSAQLDVRPDWSTRVLAQVHADPMFECTSAQSMFAHVEGTRWQSRFTHLVGYGASYYSYLLDRVLASRIWDRVFKGDDPSTQLSNNPLNREAGERFRNELLRWGGGRDPWTCLAAVLDNGESSHREIEDISKGNKSAMHIVGTWQLPDM